VHLPNNHIFYSASPDIAEIVKPLKRLGISYFTYGRKYADGATFCLQDGNDALSVYYKNKHYLKGNTECRIENYKEQVALWSTLPNQKVIDECTRAMGFDHGMFMFHPHEDYNEVFAFATFKGNEKIINTYLTEMETFLKFKQYFREKADPIIKKAEQQKFILPFNDELDIRSALENHDENHSVLLSTCDNKKLTKRQLECCLLLMKGKTAKDIALVLGLSHRTVEDYLNQIKIKLGCSNKTELIIKLADMLA